MSENLKNQKTLNLQLNFPVKVCAWWNMQYNLSANGLEVNTQFNGRPLALRQMNFGITLSQRFTFGSGFSGEISGWYRSTGLFGAYRIRPSQELNLGLRKQFGEHGGVLSAAVTDLFNLNVFRAEGGLEMQGISRDARLDFNPMTFKLSYKRDFGSQEVKAARNRGEAEEKHRVQ